jgi:hypothetical protein
MKKARIIFSGLMALFLSGCMVKSSTMNNQLELNVISGYYWNGWIDAREPLIDGEQAYIKNASKDRFKQRITEENYNWYTLAGTIPDIPNGSYVEVYYSGVVLESSPARINQVADVKIID